MARLASSCIAASIIGMFLLAVAAASPEQSDQSKPVGASGLDSLMTVTGKGKSGSSPASEVRTHEPSAPAEAARHQKECRAGDLPACHAAALDAYYSPSSPSTDRDAFELFKRACDAGYAPSCNGLGVLYAEGRGIGKDVVRAAQLYRVACAADGSTGCQHLAEALSQGVGVVKDQRAAQRARARAKCLNKAPLSHSSIAACPVLLSSKPVDP